MIRKSQIKPRQTGKVGKFVEVKVKTLSQRHGASNKMVSKRRKTLIRKHLLFRHGGDFFPFQFNHFWCVQFHFLVLFHFIWFVRFKTPTRARFQVNRIFFLSLSRSFAKVYFSDRNSSNFLKIVTSLFYKQMLCGVYLCLFVCFIFFYCLFVRHDFKWISSCFFFSVINIFFFWWSLLFQNETKFNNKSFGFFFHRNLNRSLMIFGQEISLLHFFSLKS